MHLQDYNKVSNFSDWVKPVWAVIFNNIYEINLLDKNIVFQIKYDEAHLSTYSGPNHFKIMLKKCN